jgi:hypothetical protein
MHKNKINRAQVMAALNTTCPSCGYSISPAEIVRIDFELLSGCAAPSAERLFLPSLSEYAKRIRTVAPARLRLRFCPSALGTHEAADLPRSTAKVQNAAEDSVARECDAGIKIGG